MKKVVVSAMLAATVGAMLLGGCGKKEVAPAAETGAAAESTEEAAPEAAEEAAPAETAEDPSAKSEGVMTYAEYAEAAADNTVDVSVETYVQAKQGWWEDNGVGVASLYTQDPDGAYFIYNLPMSEEEYNQLVEGQKIRVDGVKSAWSGENEIVDGTLEILDGNWIAEAKDVTDLLDDDSLIDYQNQKVKFTDLTVEAADESGAAFLYNWDGSGSQGDDLYFNVSDGTDTHSFTVTRHLCGPDTDVYKAVEALQVGDKIDAEGFLYWYEGVNPHITSVVVK